MPSRNPSLSRPRPRSRQQLRRPRRRRAVRSLAAPLLAHCIVLLAAAPALAQAGLGEPAPDFTLTASSGESFTLSDGFGRQVQLLHMIGYA